MADKFDDKKKIGEIKTEVEVTETVVSPEVKIEVLDEGGTNLVYGVDVETPSSETDFVTSEPDTGNSIKYDSSNVPSENVVADGSSIPDSSESVSGGDSGSSSSHAASGSDGGTGASDDYVNNGYGSGVPGANESETPAGEALDNPNKPDENKKDEPQGEDSKTAPEGNKNPKPDDNKTEPQDDKNKKDVNPNSGENPVPPNPNNGEDREGGLPKKDGLEDKDKTDKNPDAKGLDKDKKPNDGDKDPNAQGRNVAPKSDAPKKTGNTAGTDVANRNLDHNRRMQDGKKAEEGAGKKKNKGTDSDNKKDKGTDKKTDNKDKKKKDNKTKAKGKANTKNKIGKALDVGNKIKHPFRSAFDFLKNKLWLWLLAHPHILVAILIALVLFLLIIAMFVITGGGGSGNANGQTGTRCNYELNGVLSTGTLSASGLKVELVNCSATESNYTVLETVELEKYVLGVALAEIGPSASPEALKAQIVAARNFTLTRNSGMCPGNPDNCFYGYNASSGKIRMRACENDQVYWDYDKNIYRQDQGAVSLYSPEISTGTLWKSALSSEKKAEILKIAEEVKGVVLLDDSGNVMKTPYNSTVSTAFNDMAGQGKTYQEILSAQYGVSNYNDASCSYDGELFYGDYVLTSDGTSILTQRLDMFLSSNGSSLETFGAQITENVSTAGYGTRAGVVAAAVTLIGELGNNYGVKVPYYWGGGHYDGVVVGPLGYWGSTECHTYANNQHYNYCGFDCSGFVPWAIKNGGFNMAQKLAGDFQNIAGAEKVSLKSNLAVLQPGDLLESSGHIVLVIGVDEDMKQYICAEAAGNQYGVLFTRRSFNENGYWGVRMDGFYNNPSNIRSA